MKEENPALELSYEFALTIMALASKIREKREYDLASQLWRSGPSIGANVEEAQAAQSRADFRSKMAIASKEARETHYWLRLTRDGKVMEEQELSLPLAQAESLRRLLTAIVKSTDR
jgi:four helix bundle protein